MNFETQKRIFQKIEKDRYTWLILLAAGDRPGSESRNGRYCVTQFVEFPDGIGPTEKFSLMLHTIGGDASVALQLANFIRLNCEKFEATVPLKALNAGALISMGANIIVMTKQAVLGLIDHSAYSNLGPSVKIGEENHFVPFSTESFNGCFEFARRMFGIKSKLTLGFILNELSKKTHPRFKVSGRLLLLKGTSTNKTHMEERVLGSTVFGESLDVLHNCPISSNEFTLLPE